jgi:hypothetical protein
MAAEWAIADTLKIAVVALMGVGYAAYKTGLLDRIRNSQGERVATFRHRPTYPPARLRFDRAVLDVCGIDHLQLIRTTAKLRKLGFWTVGDFALPSVATPLGQPQKAFVRAFVHGEDAVYAMIVERHCPKAPPQYVDFLTVFADQTFLTTTNSDEADDPRRPSVLRFHRISGLLPEELYQHHHANLEALRNNWLKPVPASRDLFFSHLRQWLVVDHELRRAMDEEVKKDQVLRALESMPPIDIGPILKRFDGQRPHLEVASRPERDFHIEQASPTTIRMDPERAPIRRRLPSSPMGQSPAVPPATAGPGGEFDPALTDDLLVQSGGFQVVYTEPELPIPEGHPLEMLDRLEIAPPLQETPIGFGEIAQAPDYGADLAYEDPFATDVPAEYDTPAIREYAIDELATESAPLDIPTDLQDAGEPPVFAYEAPAASPPSDIPAPTFDLGTTAASVNLAPPFAEEPLSEVPPPTFSDVGAPLFGSEALAAPIDFGLPTDPPSLTPADPAPPDSPPDEPPQPFADFAIPGDEVDPIADLAGFAEPIPKATEEIRISLREIQAWRPPEIAASRTPPAEPAPIDVTYDAPARCPHCRARTLSKYSQRCHKCQNPLREASGE